MMSPFRIPPVPYRIHYGTRIRTTDFRTEPYNQKLRMKSMVVFDVKNPHLTTGESTVYF